MNQQEGDRAKDAARHAADGGRADQDVEHALRDGHVLRLAERTEQVATRLATQTTANFRRPPVDA